MRIYNSNSVGFKPLRKRAQSPRQIRKANIGEPETRLPPPPEQRLVYLDEELAERERKAQVEIERKKCVLLQRIIKERINMFQMQNKLRWLVDNF